ncbi:MAG TPA: hypothetical protein VFZ66_27310 [Herpetosiphonaceae bacterium]
MEENSTFNQVFSLTEWNFYKFIRPAAGILGFNPKSVVEFSIILPFYLPFPQEATLSIHVEKKAICTYKFFEIVREESLIPGQEDAPTVDIKNSRVEMIYTTSEEIDIFGENLDLTAYFDTLMEKLNFYIIAYLIKTKNINTYRVSKEMLHFTCFFRCIALSNWHNMREGLFYLNENLPQKLETLSEDILNDVVVYVHIINQKINPFILHEELLMKARRQFKDGFYQDAVLYAQMSIEEFLNTLYINILLHEGKSDVEAELLREQIPFMTMVKKEFHLRLGGKWDINNPTTELGRWYKDVYLLRNVIAHKGYFPSFSEVDKALAATHDFRLYVVSLIRKKKKVYQKLSEYFIVGV